MRLSHITWNVIGLSLPLLVAAVSVPHLIDRLGVERFGLLTLAWGLIGYAGALDLGIGRALTQMVSRLRGEKNLSAIPNALVTAERITLGAGLVGAGVIATSAILGAASFVNAATVSSTEITNAILVLAIALPAQSMSATYKGLNEAFLNFRGINLLRIGLGIVNFGGPYLVSQYTLELSWLIATLMISRVLSLAIYRWLAHSCLNEIISYPRHVFYSRAIAKSLFSFGGWTTVSNVLSPLMTQADRFLIAYILSASAVATYVLPYELVVQMLIIVGAITSVIFPTMSNMIHQGDNQWKKYFKKWLLISSAIMLLSASIIGMMLPYILQIWLNNNYAPDSAEIGKILCVGVFANTIGSMYYALLHARGRTEITAKLHIMEAPIYIITLCFFVSNYGVIGASWAWTARMIVDAISLLVAEKIISRKD
jgi:O-antigen/teichoic acid export membrane protein